MEFGELIEESGQELKRADHLIFVSLKYTRTTDVIKSIIERLSSAITLMIEVLLKTAEQEGKISEVPVSPGQRSDLVKTLYPDEKLNEIIDFYLYLRKILRSKYTSKQEFRKHVTMTVILPDDEIEITTDVIREYYEKTKGYVSHMISLVKAEQ